jgi:heme exporter protein A
MLDVIEVDFDYQEHALLEKVSFHLPAGGLLHLRGANGVGKTSLLKLIAGLYSPSQGQILFAGETIEKNLPAYQRQLCYLGHKTGIHPYLTLKENCFFDLHCELAKKNLVKLAAIFKLEPYLDTPCGLLSAGQKRQVGLLRLWMSDAKLWLLDEPLVALDDFSLNLIMMKIESHRKSGGGVILTSHQSLSIKSDYQEFFL